MNIQKNIIVLAFLLASFLLVSCDKGDVAQTTVESSKAEQKTPKGYNTPIPSSIMTPDKVKTRIGTLEFFDGVPTEKTAELALDNLTFLRGVEAFLNGLPMASIHALVEGYKSIDVTEAHHMIVTDKLMDSNPLFLTANTDTVYAFNAFDLEKTGPLVIEVPRARVREQSMTHFSVLLLIWAHLAPIEAKVVNT